MRSVQPIFEAAFLNFNLRTAQFKSYICLTYLNNLSARGSGRLRGCFESNEFEGRRRGWTHRQHCVSCRGELVHDKYEINVDSPDCARDQPGHVELFCSKTWGGCPYQESGGTFRFIISTWPHMIEFFRFLLLLSLNKTNGKVCIYWH